MMRLQLTIAQAARRCTVAPRAAVASFSGTVCSSQHQHQLQLQQQQHRWKATSATEMQPSSTNQKHLQLVTQILQDELAKKAAVESSSSSNLSSLDPTKTEVELQEKTETLAAQQKMEEAWEFFENSLENARSCVADVKANETPEHFLQEVDTAEHALSKAQAAFLDIVDLKQERSGTSEDRQEAATAIRKLRAQLEECLKEQQQDAEESSA